MTRKEAREIEQRIASKEAESKAHVAEILSAIKSATPEALHEAASVAKCALRNVDEKIKILRNGTGRFRLKTQ